MSDWTLSIGAARLGNAPLYKNAAIRLALGTDKDRMLPWRRASEWSFTPLM